MVESEERPFSRPNSRGLFKSTKTETDTKIRMTLKPRLALCNKIA